MSASVDSSVDSLFVDDKLDLLKDLYKLAIDLIPDYREAREELNQYVVDLPENPDIADLSKINKLYALAQAYSSRVTTIEINAIDNETRWKRLVNILESYISDKSDHLMSSSAFTKLSIPKAQALIKTKLKQEYRGLYKLQNKLEIAISYRKMAELRKRDLTSILTTLGKQVKAMSLEQLHS